MTAFFLASQKAQFLALASKGGSAKAIKMERIIAPPRETVRAPELLFWGALSLYG